MALLKSIPSEVIDMMKKLLIIVLVVALIVFFIAGFTAAIFSGIAISKVDIK